MVWTPSQFLQAPLEKCHPEDYGKLDARRNGSGGDNIGEGGKSWCLAGEDCRIGKCEN